MLPIEQSTTRQKMLNNAEFPFNWQILKRKSNGELANFCEHENQVKSSR